jgi:hypothetical protein
MPADSIAKAAGGIEARCDCQAALRLRYADLATAITNLPRTETEGKRTMILRRIAEHLRQQH